MTETNRRKRWPLEVRRNDDGTLDEIVCDGAYVHLEQMDDKTWWLAIEKGRKKVHVWIGSSKPVTAEAHDA